MGRMLHAKKCLSRIDFWAERQGLCMWNFVTIVQYLARAKYLVDFNSVRKCIDLAGGSKKATQI